MDLLTTRLTGIRCNELYTPLTAVVSPEGQNHTRHPCAECKQVNGARGTSRALPSGSRYRPNGRSAHHRDTLRVGGKSPRAWRVISGRRYSQGYHNGSRADELGARDCGSKDSTKSNTQEWKLQRTNNKCFAMQYSICKVIQP